MKENCCSYCLKLYPRIDRHYLDIHKNEHGVQFIIGLPKSRGVDERSKTQRAKRRRAFDALKAPGNMIFNMSKVLNPSGKQIVKRRALSETGRYKNRGNIKNTLSKKLIEKRRIVEEISRSGKRSPDDQTKKSSIFESEELVPQNGDNEEFDKDSKSVTYNRGTQVRIYCSYCGNLFSPKSIGSHMKKIHGLENSEKYRTLQKDARAAFEPINSLASDRVKKEIFPSLRHDMVSEIIKTDHLIIAWLNFSADKYTARHHDSMLRQEARLLGEIVLSMKQNYPRLFVNFFDAFTHRNFEEFSKCLRLVVGIDPNTQLPEKPGKAEKLNFLIQSVIDILRADLIILEENDLSDQLDKFQQLFKQFMPMYMGRKGREKRKLRSRHQQQEELPTPEEKQIFEDWVCQKTDACLKYFKKNDFSSDFSSSKHTMKL